MVVVGRAAAKQKGMDATERIEVDGAVVTAGICSTGVWPVLGLLIWTLFTEKFFGLLGEAG
jgi:hypothetical protein